MDLDHIRSLVELMVANDLSRVEIHDGETRILLRRGHPPVIAPPSNPIAYAQAPMLAAPAGATGGPAGGSETAAPEAAGEELYVRSPMVGTFYTSASPDSAPFVTVGSVVGPDTVVCLIEAMKVFNEIKSNVSGRVTRAFVKNGQPVEYDQKLFAVAPA